MMAPHRETLESVKPSKLVSIKARISQVSLKERFIFNEVRAKTLNIGKVNLWRVA